MKLDIDYLKSFLALFLESESHLFRQVSWLRLVMIYLMKLGFFTTPS